MEYTVKCSARFMTQNVEATHVHYIDNRYYVDCGIIQPFKRKGILMCAITWENLENDMLEKKKKKKT